MAEEQDKMLPVANVGRIMKQILPPSAKISKEAKERMQECATEFVSFVTGEASDKCHKENRKTINGEDICWAFSSLGFDEYSEAMEKYLNRYRMEVEKEKANQNKGASSSTRNKDEVSSSSKGHLPRREHAEPSTSLGLRVLQKGKKPLTKSS